MTAHQLARTVVPLATDEQCEFLLWNFTSFPFLPAKEWMEVRGLTVEQFFQDQLIDSLLLAQRRLPAGTNQ